VIVRGQDGVEHFARLKVGQVAPAIGRTVQLTPTPQGARIEGLGRGAEFGRG
jgi:hypothetical protein